jgi:cytidylate kinase
MSVDTLSLSVAEALLRTQRPSGTHPSSGPSARLAASVAISREVGALGETIARELGRRLGCPVYGREIIEKIAAELRLPPSQLETLDERPTFWLEDWLSGMPGNARAVSMDTFVKFLCATIRGLAEMGRCVIVGRGAARFLPPEHTLRVRLVADHADRVLRVAQLRHVSEREAAEWLDFTEQERDAFIRRNFGVDHADPHHYDLVLNTSRLSVDESADVIVRALAHLEKHAEKQELVVPAR